MSNSFTNPSPIDSELEVTLPSAFFVAVMLTPWLMLRFGQRKATGHAHGKIGALGRIYIAVAKPILIVHGERDRQIPPTSAERLETLARARKNSLPVEVARVADVNHLLVPAETGEVDEYERLPSRQVSPGVTAPIVAWLQRTLHAVR